MNDLLNNALVLFADNQGLVVFLAGLIAHLIDYALLRSKNEKVNHLFDVFLLFADKVLEALKGRK